jgi:hypothetical protein
MAPETGHPVAVPSEPDANGLRDGIGAPGDGESDGGKVSEEPGRNHPARRRGCERKDNVEGTMGAIGLSGRFMKQIPLAEAKYQEDQDRHDPPEQVDRLEPQGSRKTRGETKDDEMKDLTGVAGANSATFLEDSADINCGSRDRNEERR